MEFHYLAHIAAGAVSLATGYVALYSAKGSKFHRKAGMAFYFAMLAMCGFGGLIAGLKDVAPALNGSAAILTAYFVLTGVSTVRPALTGPRWIPTVLLLAALGVGLLDLSFGIQAIANGGARNGMPAFPFFLFGITALIGVAGDFHLRGAGSLSGAARMTRHLWRITFALFVAALSFFLGQAKVFPKPVRIPGLLALPVLAVLLTMFYWIWRVRVSKRNLPAQPAHG